MSGMGAGPMMDAMCPMMRAMMSGGMIGGGMPMGQTDPKAMAQMLQMRGDMLKAIGDVMLKYGKTMEGSAR